MFTKGQEVWSDLHGVMVVIFASGGYAYVRDEDNNSYTIPEDELRPLDDDTLSTDEMEQLR